MDDRDGSESLALVITGVPVGATLSAGTQNPDGSWTLIPPSPNSLAPFPGLTLTPPANFSGTINLTVTAIATETQLNGVDFDLTNNVASYSAPLVVTVNPVADVPTLTVTNTQTYEDDQVTITLTASSPDPSETLTITIGSLTGWTVTNLNGGTFDGNTWTFVTTGSSFTGGPTIKPPAESDVDRNLNVSVTSTDGASTSTPVTGTITVVVDAVLDPPVINVSNTTVVEDNVAPLISASPSAPTETVRKASPLSR